MVVSLTSLKLVFFKFYHLNHHRNVLSFLSSIFLIDLNLTHHYFKKNFNYHLLSLYQSHYPKLMFLNQNHSLIIKIKPILMLHYLLYMELLFFNDLSKLKNKILLIFYSFLTFKYLYNYFFTDKFIK